MKPPWIDQGWLIIARSVASRGIHPPPTTADYVTPVTTTLYDCNSKPMKSNPTTETPANSPPSLARTWWLQGYYPTPRSHPRTPSPPFPLLCCYTAHHRCYHFHPKATEPALSLEILSLSLQKQMFVFLVCSSSSSSTTE